MIPYSMNPLGIGQYYTDLDILRQIRDANPTSQLPSLWLDSEDPYTQWEGVYWNVEKTYVAQISFESRNVTNLNKINKLKQVSYISCRFNNGLTTLDISDMQSLIIINCALCNIHQFKCSGSTNITSMQISANKIVSLDITGLTKINTLYVSRNLLTSITSLTSKNLIVDYDFTYNITDNNEIATKAIRLCLERIRKQTGKSIKHWFITELGHEKTERLHLHGIVKVS